MEHFKIQSGAKYSLFNMQERCDISSLLLTKFLKFLQRNNYKELYNHYNLTNIDPDFYIINSCCVAGSHMEDISNLIKQLKEKTIINQKPIILFGCFTGIELHGTENIIKFASKNIVNADKIFEHKISINNIESYSTDSRLFHNYQTYSHPNQERILISQGCNYFCTYCNIKNSKGGTRSRSFDEIELEVKEICSAHGKDIELYLISDDCGSYGTDINTNIIELLDLLLGINYQLTVAVHYLYPQVLVQHKDDFLRLVESKRINYICIPLQSGSQRILDIMKREYTIGTVCDIIKNIRTLHPDIWLYNHILFSFNTETLSDLMKSLNVCRLFDETNYIEYQETPTAPARKLEGALDDLQKMKRKEMVDKCLSNNGPIIDSGFGVSAFSS